jgi:hypothetical protein
MRCKIKEKLQGLKDFKGLSFMVRCSTNPIRQSRIEISFHKVNRAELRMRGKIKKILLGVKDILAGNWPFPAKIC